MMKFRIKEKKYQDNSVVYVIQLKFCWLCMWDDFSWEFDDLKIPKYFKTYNDARDSVNILMKEIASNTVVKETIYWESKIIK